MAKGGRGVGTSPSILGQSLIDVNLTFLDLQSCGQGGQRHFQRCGEDGQADSFAQLASMTSTSCP
jgi:hypothetical protein